MKVIKKIVPLFLFIMCCVILAGCSFFPEKKDKTKVYTATNVVYDGIALDISEVTDGDFKAILRPDSSAVLIFDDVDEEGSWVETKDGFNVIIDADTYCFIGDGKNMKIEYNDVVFNFVLQETTKQKKGSKNISE